MKRITQGGHALVLLTGIVGTACGSDLSLKLIAAAEPYILGDPAPITLQVTNSGRFACAFTAESSSGEGSSGVDVELTQVASGRAMKRIRGALPEPRTLYVGAGTNWSAEIVLSDVFDIQEAGRYVVRARYQVYGTDQDPVTQTYVTRKSEDIVSEPTEITVKLPDQEKIGQIQRLLRSTKGREVEEGIALAASAVPSVFRNVVGALWATVRSSRGKRKNAALKVVLERIEIADTRIPDAELASELKELMTSTDEALRIAGAKSYRKMRPVWYSRDPLRVFGFENLYRWYKAEKSATCREDLVSAMYGAPGVMLGIMQNDDSPQVRLAAALQMRMSDPKDAIAFIKVASSLTGIREEVKVRGTNAPLGEVLAGAIETYIDMLERNGYTELLKSNGVYRTSGAGISP